VGPTLCKGCTGTLYTLAPLHRRIHLETRSDYSRSIFAKQGCFIREDRLGRVPPKDLAVINVNSWIVIDEQYAMHQPIILF
jgi:hypothetical protein